MTQNKLKPVYPMLADSGNNEGLWESDKYWAEEKIDGSRYIAHISEDGIRFTSRQISSKTGIHVEKTENVPHLSQWHKIGLQMFDGTILDGEMRHKDFSRTISIMGSSPDKALALQEQIGFIDYHVFDILEYRGQNVRNLDYEERRQMLEILVRELRCTHIKATEVCKENKKAFYDAIVDRGGEGVILKNIYGVYVEGERSKDWIKVKRYITDDVIMIRATEPTKGYTGSSDTWRYWQHKTKDIQHEVPWTMAEASALNLEPVTKAWYMGWIGAIVFGKYVNGVLTELGQTTGIDDDMRAQLTGSAYSLKKMYVGTVMEIGAMEIIKKTFAYRHPRFLRLRPDANPSDCKIEK